MIHRKAWACDGKMGFETYLQAMKAQKPRNPVKGRKLKIYRCPFCKLFHLGGTQNAG